MSSFFSGKMQDFMDNVGAVSTADPHKDKIFINALLTDGHPVIIFPEGQIIKDKKIIEKGKYIIYNTGIRRPPHSGAARIALLTEFIREKLRTYKTRNDMASVARIASRFDFSVNDLEKIIRKETYIVPVNITYYPVRARENALSRLAGKFSKTCQPACRKNWRLRDPSCWARWISTSTSASRLQPEDMPLQNGK